MSRIIPNKEELKDILEEIKEKYEESEASRKEHQNRG